MKIGTPSHKIEQLSGCSILATCPENISTIVDMAIKGFNNLRSKLADLFTRRPEETGSVTTSLPFNCLTNIMNCYRTGSYDNNFPNITRIAESFAEVEPFAVDSNGNRIDKNPHLLDVLYNPNEEMSGSDFWETLIVMMLVHPIVYLLVWHEERGNLIPGGPVNRDNIAGITFMENVTSTNVGGVTTYYCGNQTYGKSDILALSLNVNPYSLASGYSPSIAAKKWATVDDYIADYQSGYFANGAVPSGQFVITAKSVEEFNDIVDGMQQAHRGPRNANNVQYVHRPVSQIDGKPVGAQVEWIPFSQPSDAKTLQAIFDQANKKLDMDFGVPQEVKGYLQNSNYASAEVAEYVFSRYVLYPKLKKVYAKMTHELNRVTGGLGFALSFDFEFPVLTDTRKAQADTLRTLLDAGFTVESSIEALQLPRSFLKLVQRQTVPVPTDNNVSNAPSQNEDMATAKRLKQKVVEDDLQTEQIWRQKLNPELVKILSSYLFGIIDQAKKLIEDNPEERPNIAKLLRQWLKESGYSDKTVTMIVTILAYIMLQIGQETMPGLAEQVGLNNLDMELSQEDYDKLKAHIEELVNKFADDTVSNIDKTLNQELSMVNETPELLAAIDLMKTSEDYRISRWAISEQHLAEETAVIIATTIVSRGSSRPAYKVWRINYESPDICSFCIRMNGEKRRLGEAFSNGQMVPHYHPHCYCTMEVFFEDEQKTVKITCPHCGRYMMESAGGVMKNVICANSKCKKHYDFEVNNGKVKAIERN